MLASESLSLFRGIVFKFHIFVDHNSQHFCNLRSGPILAVLIHSLLRRHAKIGPDTKSHKLVLTAARFDWLLESPKVESAYSLRGCSIQKSFEWMRMIDANDPPLAERRIFLCF